MLSVCEKRRGVERHQKSPSHLQSEFNSCGVSPQSASPPVVAVDVSRGTGGKMNFSTGRETDKRCPEVLVLFSQTVYSVKLKFRPEASVIGDEGPALDTALEGMLPCHRGWLGGRRDVSDPEEDRGCCGL